MLRRGIFWPYNILAKNISQQLVKISYKELRWKKLGKIRRHLLRII